MSPIGLRGFVLFMFYQVRIPLLVLLQNIFKTYVKICIQKIGTMATKYKKNLKAKLDAETSTSSVRGPTQVLACSILAVGCSLLHAYYFGEETSIGERNYLAFR